MHIVLASTLKDSARYVSGGVVVPLPAGMSLSDYECGSPGAVWEVSELQGSHGGTRELLASKGCGVNQLYAQSALGTLEQCREKETLEEDEVEVVEEAEVVK